MYESLRVLTGLYNKYTFLHYAGGFNNTLRPIYGARVIEVIRND